MIGMSCLDAEHSPAIETIDRMLGALLEQRRAIRELNDRWHEVTASMPWWAQPGKRLLGLSADGRPYLTGHCWAPAISGVDLATCDGGFALVRPSEDDIFALAEYRKAIWGKAGAARAHALRSQELRALTQRQDAMRAERERSGADRIAAMMDAATGATVALQDQLLAMPPSPERAALQLLFDTVEDVDISQSMDCDELARSVDVLQVLQPLLAGRTSDLVRTYLQDTTRPMAGTPLSCASWGDYQRSLAREDDTFDIPLGLIAPIAFAS